MWLHVPCASSPSVPGSECTTLDSERLSMLARCATSSGKPLLPASWSRLWKRNAWMKRLSGLTSELSTLDRGVERWIAWWRDCPASPTAKPGSSAGTTTTGPSETEAAPSLSSSASSPSVDPPWSSSKMSQPGLFKDGFDPLARNYADWVLRSKTRSSSLRKTLAHRTRGSGCGSWPTSRAEDGESCGNHPDATDSLTGAIRNWPTAKVSAGGYSYSRGDHFKPVLNLEGAAASWPTPAARDEKNGDASPETLGRNARPLSEIAHNWSALLNWPSPAARDGDPRRAPTDPNGRAWRNKVARGAVNAAGMLSDDLNSSASARKTPTVPNGGRKNPETTSDTGMTADGRKTQVDLMEQSRRFSRRVRSTLDGRELSPTRRTLRPRLNPAFACWLMGLPILWTNPVVTNCVQSEMAAYRSAVRSRLQRLLGG